MCTQSMLKTAGPGNCDIVGYLLLASALAGNPADLPPEILLDAALS